MEQKRVLRTVLLLSWMTYMTAYLCRVNLSTVLDKLAVGLGVSVEYLGAASSVYFVTYAVGQLLNGAIGDRVNPHRFLMLALVMTGGINLIIGLQSSGSLFFLLWGLNGFCQSMFWSTLLRLLSVYSKEEQRKNVSTIMSTCSVTGYLLSWVVLSSMLQTLSFRPYFLIPGVIALALALPWYVLSKKLPFQASSAGRRPTPPLREVAREFAEDLLLLVLIPFAKLAGVFLARAVLAVFRENVRTAMIAMLTLACGIAGTLVLTSRHTAFFTVLLIAGLIAVINASNWYMISYLPLYFSGRNIVSTLVGTFDFSTYVGASIMSGLLLALTGTGGCLRRKGARRNAMTSV